MKRFFIVFILAFFSSLIFAQSFKAGFQLGITGTQVTGDLLSGYKKAGIYGGFFVVHPVTERSGFQLEMSFIQKGSRKNAKPSDGDYNQYLMRLNYIEMPIFYKYTFKRNLTAELGLSFGYLISSYEADENGPIEQQGLPDFKKVEFTGIIGLGYQMNEHMRFFLRYSYSVLPIRSRPTGYYNYINAGQFNDVLCTAFQYQF